MRQENVEFWDGTVISWTICTSLQTDNHTNTSSLSFYRPDVLPDAQPTVSKQWKQMITVENWTKTDSGSMLQTSTKAVI